MRGEDMGTMAQAHTRQGSPPHARGRPVAPPSLAICRRITPACAGKTLQACQYECLNWDHPRTRGEDSVLDSFFVSVHGSPPHARGRHVTFRCYCSTYGITPACAGKTKPIHTTSAARQDHPRMRGEDQRFKPFHYPRTGSPPHARGRL